MFKIHDPWKVPENSVLEWNYSKSLTSKQKSLKKHVGNLALLILVFRECRNFTREHFEPWIQNKLMASVCWLFISTPMMWVGVWCIFLVQRLVVVSCIVCIFILVPKNSWSRNSLNCFSCRDQCNFCADVSGDTDQLLIVPLDSFVYFSQRRHRQCHL